MSIRETIDRMKLKKHLNRKSKESGKEFFRYDITINQELVKALKWKEDQTLKASVKNDKLVIEKE
jgi:hypothetical protein